ncbi:unnamed protein product, partial [Amoebophrya sp. A120]
FRRLCKLVHKLERVESLHSKRVCVGLLHSTCYFSGRRNYICECDEETIPKINATEATKNRIPTTDAHRCRFLDLLKIQSASLLYQSRFIVPN